MDSSAALEGDLAMRLRGVLFKRDLVEGAGSLCIEETALKAGSVEPLGRAGHEVFRDDTLPDSVGEGVEARRPDAAGEIGAGPERERGGVEDIGSVVVAACDVDDGCAVRDDEAVEAPGATEVIAEQQLAGAVGVVVDGVIGAHDGLDVAVDDGGAKGGQVSLFEIAGRDVDVKDVAQRFGSAVHGEVLAGGDRLGVFGIVALHTADEGDSHASGQEGSSP